MPLLECSDLLHRDRYPVPVATHCNLKTSPTSSDDLDHDFPPVRAGRPAWVLSSAGCGYSKKQMPARVGSEAAGALFLAIY